MLLLRVVASLRQAGEAGASGVPVVTKLELGNEEAGARHPELVGGISVFLASVAVTGSSVTLALGYWGAVI